MSTQASYTAQDDTKVTESDSALPLQLNQAPRHQWAIGVSRDGRQWRGSLAGARRAELEDT